MKYLRLIIPALFVALQAAAVLAGGVPSERIETEPQRILFVGNSFTYYNNGLHSRLRELMKAGHKQPGSLRSLTLSGARLEEHGAALPALLGSDDWDVVVLQGHSVEPIEAERVAAFRRAARDHHGLIEESGARPVFFMTWAYEGNPEHTGMLDEAYSAIGEELGAQVVPVGIAFELVSERHPEISLRIADDKHPTLAGTYLAACTFYAALLGDTPVGLDYDAGLGAAVAEKLQAGAWQAVIEYDARRR